MSTLDESEIKIGLRGGRFVGIDPIDVSQLLLGDLARGLSRINRFAGQTDYTVAQHSVVLSRCYPGDKVLQRAALLHDAPEALGVGDVNTHLKRIYAGNLRWMEGQLFEAVWERYGWTTMSSLNAMAAVAKYDRLMGAAEAIYFGFGSTVTFALPAGWVGWKPLSVWKPDEAMREWTRAFEKTA